MKIHAIDTGLFKLDGGAMFGVVPKSLWTKKVTADKDNLVTLAMRCLLIEEGNRLILIDTGLGDKQDEKFFSYLHPHGDTNLLASLHAKGFSADDVTDVILTHLHFDHVGGAVSKDKNGKLYPTFKNATYWSHSKHWDWAMTPNPREKASFLKENFEPLMASDQVKFIDEHLFELGSIDFMIAKGHTESQIIPKISYKEQTLVYCADLLPSVHHIPMAWVVGYDVRPLVSINEKETLFKQAIDNNYILLLEHDATNQACTLKQGNRGAELDQILIIDDL